MFEPEHHCRIGKITPIYEKLERHEKHTYRKRYDVILAQHLYERKGKSYILVGKLVSPFENELRQLIAGHALEPR